MSNNSNDPNKDILVQRLGKDKTWTTLLTELDTMRTILKTDVVKDQVFIDANVFTDKIEEFFDEYLAKCIGNNGLFLWELLTLISTMLFPTNKRTWIEIVDHLWTGLFVPKTTSAEENQLSINNNELLDALIFGYEGPVSAESFLHRDDIFILDKVIKCFSDPLIFSKSNQTFQLYEDHILATLSQASRDLSGRARLRHLAGFVGLTTTKAMYYDENRGEEIPAIYYGFKAETLKFIEKYNFIIIDPETNRRQLNALPRELFLCLIQAWRVFNKNELDEYTVNAFCGGLALHLITGFFDLEQSQYNKDMLAKLPKQLFHEKFFLQLITPLIKIVAYFINGNNWLELIFDSKSKKNYHRLVRATTLGPAITLENGVLYAKNNSIIQKIHDQSIRPHV